MKVKLSWLSLDKSAFKNHTRATKCLEMENASCALKHRMRQKFLTSFLVHLLVQFYEVLNENWYFGRNVEILKYYPNVTWAGGIEATTAPPTKIYGKNGTGRLSNDTLRKKCVSCSRPVKQWPQNSEITIACLQRPLQCQRLVLGPEGFAEQDHLQSSCRQQLPPRYRDHWWGQHVP